MTNINCLQGIRCPECGSEEPFLIEMTGTVKAFDAGTEDMYDSEWNEESYMSCVECKHKGIVADFSNGGS